MIENLPPHEKAWLSRFFASPNGLSWSSLLDGSAPPLIADEVRQWLILLARPLQGVPLILPFVRENTIAGWYATTQSRSGRYEIGGEINAWLGPTLLSSPLEAVLNASSDPMARVLTDRFGGTVYPFTGPDHASKKAISARLSDFAKVLARRPFSTQKLKRPIGAIRSDFERALLAGDEARAEAMIAEFKHTGRLNEENLRCLEVRLTAGLGMWPQIAHDPWLIKTLADLALPPQILADLIEALYRTYIDPVEATGDAEAVRVAFARNIIESYPKLFASRRGIRTPRVIKAFVLYEQLQPNPDPFIINELLNLLPTGTDTSLFRLLLPPQPTLPPATTLDKADEAYDDWQFDRAFEFYLRLAPSKKTLSRLVSCVSKIGTHETRDRFLAAVQKVEPEIIESLAPAARISLDSIIQAKHDVYSLAGIAPKPRDNNQWMLWADQLRAGVDLASAEYGVQSARTNWDATEIRRDGRLAKEFADILGKLNDEAGKIARSAVPQIYASVFPDETVATPATKPIASLLLLLIALDETLSRADLDLLSQLTILLIEQGLSSVEYTSLIGDLEDVQKRIGSFSSLPWSLDLCEALAILPCPSDATRDARLRLFLQVLSQAASFAHRLTAVDLLPLEMLAKDYGVSEEAVAALKREAKSGDTETKYQPDLNGKTIGIYTLTQSAGARAKAALEELFPGCKVVVNSDLVATAQLTNLAKTSDVFVFAWKSSSHQAFYCVKDALAGNALILASGKGTASILRAIFDHLI